MNILRKLFRNSERSANNNPSDSSFAGLVRQQTSNRRLIELAQLTETALDAKQFELALNRAGEGMEIAKQTRDKLGHLCFHEFMGMVLVEISLADIKTAYDLGMKQKAREFADKCLQFADKSGASSQRFITLMKLRDLVENYDPVFAKKFEDELAIATVKGLRRK